MRIAALVEVNRSGEWGRGWGVASGVIVYAVECQLEQLLLMSGCSWCEAAEEKETAG